MKKRVTAIVATAVLAASTFLCSGHFQILVPSTVLTGISSRDIVFDILFSHPMADGPVMEMGEPVRFGVLLHGQQHDLTELLQERKVGGATAYLADYTVKRPGDHVFFLEPSPYWEPAERKMIIHYTKVVVNAFGEQQGWDSSVGFPVEIEPLVRPYGLWTGNVFRGIVRREGQPVPFAEIEVEYWNRDGGVDVPSDAFVTQVIKTDAGGVFSYVMPRAGWWAFAALIDGDRSMKNPGGVEVDVELGGLMWVHCQDMR